MDNSIFILTIYKKKSIGFISGYKKDKSKGKLWALQLFEFLSNLSLDAFLALGWDLIVPIEKRFNIKWINNWYNY